MNRKKVEYGRVSTTYGHNEIEGQNGDKILYRYDNKRYILKNTTMISSKVVTITGSR